MKLVQTPDGNWVQADAVKSVLRSIDRFGWLLAIRLDDGTDISIRPSKPLSEEADAEVAKLRDDFAATVNAAMSEEPPKSPPVGRTPLPVFYIRSSLDGRFSKHLVAASSLGHAKAFLAWQTPRINIQDGHQIQGLLFDGPPEIAFSTPTDQ